MSTTEGGTNCYHEGGNGLRPFIPDADDEKQRRRAPAASNSALQVFLDARQKHAPVHVACPAWHVADDALGIAHQRRRLEIVLGFEEQIVHLPKAALCSRRFGGLGGTFGVLVNLAKRKIPEDEPKATAG